MWLSAVFSAVHLLSLAAGTSALVLRERALRGPLDGPGIQRVLRADNAAGLIALFWYGSGLYRAFGGLEKGTAFYLQSHAFWTKMGLLGAVFSIEMWPMVTFIRWRVAIARGRPVEPRHVRALRLVHFAELALLVAIVLTASFMARGAGQPRPKAAALASEATGVPATAGAAPAGDRGAVVYQERCLPCHQADGRGMGGRIAADLSTRLGKGDDALLRSIADGVPNTAMIGWRGRLSEDEMRAALRYVRATFGPRAAAPPGP